MLAGALCRRGQYAAAVDELAKLEDARAEDAGLNLEYIYALLRAGQARTAADLKAPEGTPILSTLFTALAREHAGDPTGLCWTRWMKSRAISTKSAAACWEQCSSSSVRRTRASLSSAK